MKPDRGSHGARAVDRNERVGTRTERYGALDPIFHERSRLAIMTMLAANTGGVPFTELRDLCGLTDGNLSRHVHKLAEAGLVKMEKQFIHGVPNTTIQVTSYGVEQFGLYVEELARIVDEANRAVRTQAQSSGDDKIRELRECP